MPNSWSQAFSNFDWYLSFQVVIRGQHSIDTQYPSSYSPTVKKEVLVTDKTKIGRLIAWGGEHFVYEYDADRVIKFSTLYFFLGPKAKEKAT